MEEQYDGARSWAVAIAASVVNMVIGGIGRTGGLFFVAFIREYGVDRKTASLPITVQYCGLFLTGPIIGILGQKFCSSKLILIGGIFGTLSTALCFISMNIMWITIVWGLLYGLSGGLVVFIPQMVVAKYFKKHKATALGIGISGSCIGCFVFPQLFESFYSEYGLEGTFLMMAGIVAHIIPASLILKDPPWTKESIGKDSDAEKTQNGFTHQQGTMVTALPNMQVLRQTNGLAVKRLMAEYSRQSERVRNVTDEEVLQEMYSWLERRATSSYTNFAFCEEPPPIKDPESNGGGSVTENGSLTSPSKLPLHSTLSSRTRTESSSSADQSELRNLRAQKGTSPIEDSNTLLAISKRALRLFTKLHFWFVCITRTYFSVTLLSMITTAVDFARDKGVRQAGYVIPALAVGDLFGRLGFGWVTDGGFVTLGRYMTVLTVAQAAVCVSLCFAAETLFLLGIVAYGVLQGMLVVTFPLLVTEYTAEGEHMIAFGCTNLFSGVIGIVMPFYIGLFRDQIGAYDYMFYVSAALAIVVGVMWFFEPYLV